MTPHALAAVTAALIETTRRRVEGEQLSRAPAEDIGARLTAMDMKLEELAGKRECS